MPWLASALFAFFLSVTCVQAQTLPAFAGIDRPVGTLNVGFIYSFKESPAPYSGRPFNYSFSNKIHGFLYLDINPSTGSGKVQMSFQNDENDRGYTVCTRTTFFGEGAELSIPHLAGVNPRGTRDVAVAVSQSVEFWQKIKTVRIEYGWCPSDKILKAIWKFFETSESNEEPISPSSSTTPIQDVPAHTALVRQHCEWPSAGDGDPATMQQNIYSSSSESCDDARLMGEATVSSRDLCNAVGSHWIKAGVDVVDTPSCRW